ncbi:glycosyltransferase family 4 protein [uncultured Ruminococcus sp.]|uniref:glycosyltransferase family 4 protein n=1 Tax=uncultured Ruminococcus sp. TaxID=165186 RepID=UPI0025DA0995|nr:glycosyltransferase family 4 protein [uncultured Ruminococcus sp.]
MRILVLANSSMGLYSFRNELLSTLLINNEVIIVTPDNGSLDKLMKLGCKTIIINIDRRGINPKTDFSLLLNYRKIIKKVKPDLVITYTIKPNIYGGLVCRFLNIPFVVNITGLGTAFQKHGALRTLVTTMYRVSMKKAKVVFFENCENQQVFIDEKIVLEYKTCLLNGAGVDLEHYSYQEYPMDTDEVRFLFVGRVMKEKGINELFRAMRMLRKTGVNCTLDVLGGYEEDYEDIIHRFEKEGWLHYHGNQEDVRPFIKNCHCFVLPSWHEGMANTNLECASSGRPVITTNIHGCLEAVIDGDSGFLCQKQDAKSLYRAMKRFACLSAEKRRAMGVAGRKHMEDVFDKRAVVDNTIHRLNNNNNNNTK